MNNYCWDYLKLLYCEFQKYEVMTLSLVDGQPKNLQIPIAGVPGEKP